MQGVLFKPERAMISLKFLLWRSYIISKLGGKLVTTPFDSLPNTRISPNTSIYKMLSVGGMDRASWLMGKCKGRPGEPVAPAAGWWRAALLAGLSCCLWFLLHFHPQNPEL